MIAKESRSRCANLRSLKVPAFDPSKNYEDEIVREMGQNQELLENLQSEAATRDLIIMKISNIENYYY